MSERQAKKQKRDMRRYFRNAGLTPEALQAKMQAAADARADEVMETVIEARTAARMKPRPKWLPDWAWRRLVTLVMSEPGG